MDLVKGPLGTLAWVLVLLHNQPWVGLVKVLRHNQPWVGWVMVHGGIQALAGQADLGSPSLGPAVGAWSLLACQDCIQGLISCQDQWRDIHQQDHLPSCLVVVLVGSLQLVVDSLLPVEGSLLSVGHSHQVEEGSHLAAVGSLQLGEDKLQAEVGKPQVVEDKLQAVAGIHLSEGGIQGSSWFRPLFSLFLKDVIL